MHHPHVHAIVTGGGLSADGSRWIHGKQSKRRKPFFAPGKVLSRVFRGKFIDSLKRAFRSGELEFHGRLKPLGDEAAFEQLLNKAVRHDWVVYAKRPFSSPACVLKYLARYTHRVAISNRRLVEMRDGRVSFRYKDYSDDRRSKVLSLSTAFAYRLRPSSSLIGRRPQLLPPLPDAHTPGRLRPHPLLRLPGEPLPE